MLEKPLTRIQTHTRAHVFYFHPITVKTEPRRYKTERNSGWNFATLGSGARIETQYQKVLDFGPWRLAQARTLRPTSALMRGFL